MGLITATRLAGADHARRLLLARKSRRVPGHVLSTATLLCLSLCASAAWGAPALDGAEPPRPVTFGRSPSLAPAQMPSRLAAEGPPNYWRTAAETSLALGLATVWYVLDERNVLDWDFPALEQRFTGEAWRFDNNGFGINYLAHPLNGAGMYVLARGNRLGPWPALGATVLGSTFWEYVIEFQEKVSINDMLITPGVGIVLGEFYHKLALYVSSSPRPRGAGSALAWTLGLSVHGHRRWDGLTAPAPRDVDSNGLSTEPWHAFEAGYGFGVAQQGAAGARGAHEVALSGRLISLPDYGTEREHSGWFGQADFACASLRVDSGPSSVGTDFYGDVWFGGYHSYQPSARTTVAVAGSYQLRDSQAFGYDDRQGLLHAPGIVGSWERSSRGLASRLVLSAFPSFGSLGTLAYPAWLETFPNERTKTIIEREGYAYLGGLTGRIEAELGWGALRLKAAATVARMESIEGLDRSQEKVAFDAHVAEQSTEGSLGLWLTPPELPLHFGLEYETRSRLSSMQAPAGAPIRQAAAGERLLMRISACF